MASARLTYVYCLVAADRRPRVRAVSGVPGAGPVRLLDVADRLFMAVSDVPADRYNESAISSGLSKLDWVSRVAVAHEAVVESFVSGIAVLPMKLFTIFTSDDRASAHMRAQRSRLAALVKRVAHHQEWGVRVAMDRERVVAAGSTKPAGGAVTGASYLAHKKAQRDASKELASRARETVAGLFDRLATRSRDAKRRAASEMPAQAGPILLDAAFLVPRSHVARFRKSAAREAKALARQGYDLTLTGPWPPYTFVQG